MTSAALDRLLAVLVVALAATGLVSLRMGGPGDGWLFVLHGVLGGKLDPHRKQRRHGRENEEWHSGEPT